MPRLFCAMRYDLPTTAGIGGKDIPVRTDFRVALELIELMNDPELDEADKAEGALVMFYPTPEEITDYGAALRLSLIHI